VYFATKLQSSTWSNFYISPIFSLVMHWLLARFYAKPNNQWLYRNRSFALSGHICTFRKLIAELRLEQFLYITNFCTGDALMLAWIKTTR